MSQKFHVFLLPTLRDYRQVIINYLVVPGTNLVQPSLLRTPSVFVPQANTLRPYLNAIRGTLDAALCLRNFPSQTVERHNKPEVEIRSDWCGREIAM